MNVSNKEQQTAVRELLEQHGADPGLITDQMVQDLLNDPDSVDEIMDSYDSDNFKKNIRNIDPKRRAKFVHPTLWEKIEKDEYITKAERDAFKNVITEKTEKLTDDVREHISSEMDMKKAVANGGIKEILGRHRRWRTIFLVLICLMSGGLVLTSSIQALSQPSLLTLFGIALGLFFFLIAFRMLTKFDPLLFSAVDSLLEGAKDLEKTEELLKGLIVAELNEFGVKHELEYIGDKNFIQFFRQTYKDILAHGSASASEKGQKTAESVQSLEGEVSHLNLELEDTKKHHKEELIEKDRIISKGVESAQTDLLVSTLAARLKKGKITDSEQAKELIECSLDAFPDVRDEIQALAYASEEHKRINQYETIMQLYNEKIAKVRSQEMDEEDREDAIVHWKRLRDTEVEELTRANDA